MLRLNQEYSRALEQAEDSQQNWRQVGRQLHPLKLESPRQTRPAPPLSARAYRQRHESTPNQLSSRMHPGSISTRNRVRSTTTMGLPNFEPTKCSIKGNGFVKAYAANTNQGIVRGYNEDRVSIILNITKPASRADEFWPRCSFFGVYDGHGGAACADFLRDNLHQFVIRDQNFPRNPKEAIRGGFRAAENFYLEKASQNVPVEKSGSCAVVVLIVGEICYVANVGDSRGVMSGANGNVVYPLSKDHKPDEEGEYQRIMQNGGRVYQSKPLNNQGAPGPSRIFPGRLSISRSFGDIEAKLPEYGGNPNVLICQPDIKAFRIQNSYDYIVLASDGIFDKLNNREIVQSIWQSVHDNRTPSVHQQCGQAVEAIMRQAIERRTYDNITVLMIAFNNFQEHYERNLPTGRKI